MMDVYNWKYELATWYSVRGLIKIAYEFMRQFTKNIVIAKPQIIVDTDFFLG